ncbi:hypothetical protein OAV77_01330 [Candidatus Marinimicrobia bacterium]|mgnify:FL=1|nr:hypothetical protein [Candidatus Neomarinimicrobiota bacterium]|tara:strand:- start:1423 stop:2442 length:1020 start_codon:yes stop_codon:yes gene_type:complete
MKKRYVLGLDGGASKILSQLFLINDKNEIINESRPFEVSYKDIVNFDQSFIPVKLEIQKKESLDKSITIQPKELRQSKVIINAIIKSIQNFKNFDISAIGFCFPGIKTKNADGVSIMANGPRNLNMLHQLNKKINLELNCSINIKNIYDDSLSCVYGEKFSSKGKLNNCSNGIYIGGGTGIADGIVYQNQIVDITAEKDFKKSWEIIADDGKSVEECLSLGGLSQKWNSKKMKSVESLNDLFLKAKMKNKKAEKILFSAGKAFNILINSRISFFKSKTNYPEKIVIGQRLGVLLNEKNHPLKNIIQKNNFKDIPIELSSNRNTAAMGAVYLAINEDNYA